MTEDTLWSTVDALRDESLLMDPAYACLLDSLYSLSLIDDATYRQRRHHAHPSPTDAALRSRVAELAARYPVRTSSNSPQPRLFA